jgi:hypothetical protein
MAIDFIEYNASTEYGSRLKSAIRNLDANQHELELLLAKMNRMNDDNDFSAMETQFGITTGKGDDARNELASYLAKVTGDGQVEFVAAARAQLVAKLG